MKIALIGAPGTGKTQLADELNEALGFDIVDDIDHVLVEDGLPLGPGSGLQESVVMHAEQYRHEFTERRAGRSFVACGTGVERVAHAAVRHEGLLLADTEEARRQAAVELIGMEILASLMVEAWGYDFVLYLPPPASADTVDELDEARAFSLKVDTSIQDVIVRLGLDVTPLPEDPEARLAAALGIIEGDQSGVADGSSPS